MKNLTKLLSLTICVMLLVGCGNKAVNDTTKTTNNNSQSTNTNETQSTQTNTNDSQKDNSKLPEGFSNEKFLEDSKQILSLIKDFCSSKKIVSKEQVSDMSKYVKTYSNKKPDTLNTKERDTFDQIKQMLVYYSQYENYSKQNAQADMDNMLKQIQVSYDNVKNIILK